MYNLPKCYSIHLHFIFILSMLFPYYTSYLSVGQTHRPTYSVCILLEGTLILSRRLSIAV